MAGQLPRGDKPVNMRRYKKGRRYPFAFFSFFGSYLWDFGKSRHSSLAQIPHSHGVASGGVKEGTGSVEGDLVDLALARWDRQNL